MSKFLLGFLTAIVLLVVIGFIILAGGAMPIDALSTPPRWEAQIAGIALNASVARRMQHQNNPIEPTDQNLMDGMKVYVMNCQECHGSPEEKSVIGSESLYPRAPQFGHRRPPSATAKQPPPPGKPSDREATTFWIVKNGIRYTAMPAWDKSLKDQEIWQVVTFLSHMRNLPPDVVKEWKNESGSDQTK